MIDDISHLFPALNVETNYRILYRGSLLEGHTPSSVERRLKNELGMTDKQVSAFLSKRKFVVRKDMPRNNAARLRAKLRQIGLDVVANAQKENTDTGEQTATTTNAVTPNQQRTNPKPRPELQTYKNDSAPASAAEAFSLPGSANSRWIIIGFCTLFTVAVIGLFFYI